jgi:acetyl-CoA/propionyl-CoA carboxylase biotin carboxyl carrier protein
MARGNGRGYGAEDYVRDILALTDALGLNRVRLIGHETGGWLGGGFVLSLADTAVVGVTTNISFLRALLAHVDVAAGRLDTGLVERHLDELVAARVPDEVLAATALEHMLAREPAGATVDPWDIPDGWRLGEPAWTTLRIETAGRHLTEVRLRGRAAEAAEVSVDGADPVPARAEYDGPGLIVTYAGCTRRYAYARHHGPSGNSVLWLGCDGHAWALKEEEALASRDDRTGAADGTVRSPMPGTVLAVQVADGQRVTSGQPLLTIEAMKMEHTVTAPLDGVVAELTAKAGQQVGMDEALAVIRAAGVDS